jgi:hypothetical protein
MKVKKYFKQFKIIISKGAMECIDCFTQLLTLGIVSGSDIRCWQAIDTDGALAVHVVLPSGPGRDIS